MNLIETWVDSPPNLKLNKYQISTYGKVLKPYCKDKYISISLYNDDKLKTYKIHQLVALSFISNPENKPTVDHINSNPQDNNISNLRWATYDEQAANRCSYKHKESKVIVTYNRNIVKIYNKMSVFRG